MAQGRRNWRHRHSARKARFRTRENRSRIEGDGAVEESSASEWKDRDILGRSYRYTISSPIASQSKGKLEISKTDCSRASTRHRAPLWQPHGVPTVVLYPSPIVHLQRRPLRTFCFFFVLSHAIDRPSLARSFASLRHHVSDPKPPFWLEIEQQLRTADPKPCRGDVAGRRHRSRTRRSFHLPFASRIGTGIERRRDRKGPSKVPGRAGRVRDRSAVRPRAARPSSGLRCRAWGLGDSTYPDVPDRERMDDGTTGRRKFPGTLRSSDYLRTGGHRSDARTWLISWPMPGGAPREASLRRRRRIRSGKPPWSLCHGLLQSEGTFFREAQGMYACWRPLRAGPKLIEALVKGSAIRQSPHED